MSRAASSKGKARRKTARATRHDLAAAFLARNAEMVAKAAEVKA